MVEVNKFVNKLEILLIYHICHSLDKKDLLHVSDKWNVTELVHMHLYNKVAFENYNSACHLKFFSNFKLRLHFWGFKAYRFLSMNVHKIYFSVFLY